jgi:hypothetical protein
MKALNEALNELSWQLKKISPSFSQEIDRCLTDWAEKNFDVMSITTHLSQEMENSAADPSSLKAHLLQKALYESAIQIGAKYGFGQEEVKMPWNHLSRSTDYYATWKVNPHQYSKELSLSFVVLKRHPTSWGSNESTSDWVKKIVGAKNETK